MRIKCLRGTGLLDTISSNRYLIKGDYYYDMS